jgi:hypothetical protein
LLVNAHIQELFANNSSHFRSANTRIVLPENSTLHQKQRIVNEQRGSGDIAK